MPYAMFAPGKISALLSEEDAVAVVAEDTKESGAGVLVVFFL